MHPARQRGQGISAALGFGARIIRAHRRRELVELGVEGRCIGAATSPQISAIPFCPGPTSMWRSRSRCLATRTASGSSSMTSQSTSSVIFSRESVFHDGALAASWASMVASAAVSVSRSVRKIAAAITRKSTAPARNTAPSVGKRSSSVVP